MHLLLFAVGCADNNGVTPADDATDSPWAWDLRDEGGAATTGDGFASLFGVSSNTNERHDAVTMPHAVGSTLPVKVGPKNAIAVSTEIHVLVSSEPDVVRVGDHEPQNTVFADVFFDAPGTAPRSCRLSGKTTASSKTSRPWRSMRSTTPRFMAGPGSLRATTNPSTPSKSCRARWPPSSWPGSATTAPPSMDGACSTSTRTCTTPS
jgi:hypothetical protein